MKRSILSAVFLILLIHSVYGNVIDSLETQLEQSSGKKKIQILNQLSEKYRYIDPQKSVKFSEIAVDLSTEENLSLLKSQALNNCAIGNYYLGNYHIAIEKYQEALELNLQMWNETEIARSYNNLGLVYRKLGKFDLSLEYNLKSLDLEKKNDNKLGIAQSICNIGNLYFEMSNFDKSLEYYQECLLAYEELQNSEGMADVLNNIGTVYDEEHRYDIALDYYLNSLDYELKLEDKTGIATTSNNIGLTYYNLQLYDKALEYLNWSLNLTLEIGEKYGIANSYINLGKTYLALGDLSKSLNNIRNGLSISSQIEALDLMMASYDLLSEIYTELQDFDKALENYKLYTKQRELLFENNKDKFARIQEQYDHMQMEKEIGALQVKIKNYLDIIIILSILISTILIVSLITRNRFKNKEIRRQELINDQLRELAQTDHLTNLANRRGMLEKIQHERHRFERNNNPFSLILGDIDEFKKVNDQFGHACGDFVLSSLSNLFVSILRKQDMVGRWGGEEFIMLLPETELDDARSLAEKIRQRVENNTFYYKGSHIGITVTFGVAVFDKIEDIEKTIKRADEAMYEGKDLGKNCVV